MSLGLKLPCLPLLLWKTPPGLGLLLRQEGVPFEIIGEGRQDPFLAGQFVVFDRRRVSNAEIFASTTREHVMIDIDNLVEGLPRNSWASLDDHRAIRSAWIVNGRTLTERVARTDRARLRHTIVGRLRDAVSASGGLWVRLASYPAPYRSAFNFRVDLDEPYPDDYFAFAQARRPIEDCTTHFISTKAYGEHAKVLDDLRGRDTQSHGHYHFVYRDAQANDRNLSRADRLLRNARIEPVGFAAPHGRWNQGLDLSIQKHGYLYSSDFQVGYDDLPFHPLTALGVSPVLQVPIHPVCEGLFLDAGSTSGSDMSDYFTAVARAKLSAGEPAFLYGHPERRLCRYPEIIRSLAEIVDEFSLCWRTTLTEFATWWCWRSERKLSVVDLGQGAFEVQFHDWDRRYPLAIEFVRGRHLAHVRSLSPTSTYRIDDFAYERLPDKPAVAPPSPAPARHGFRSMIREAIDWETVTPLEELSSGSVARRIKRHLRKRSDRHFATVVR